MSSVDNKPEILSHLGVGSGINTTALIDSLVEPAWPGSVATSIIDPATDVSETAPAFDCTVPMRKSPADSVRVMLPLKRASRS